MTDTPLACFPLAAADAAQAMQAELLGAADAVFDHAGTDSRQVSPGQLFFALRGERFDGHDYVQAALLAGARGAVVQRQAAGQPVPPGHALLVVDDTLHAWGDLASWFRRQSSIPLIGITGSVGKTTAKEMLGLCLRSRHRIHANQGNFNNLIGVPATLLATPAGCEWIVAEMGTNQPGEIGRLAGISRPQAAILTAVAPCHLEHFHTLETIAAEKGELLRAIAPEGWAVIPAEGSCAELLAAMCCCRRITFGRGPQADFRAVDIEIDDQGCAAFRLVTPGGEWPVRLGVPGTHQVFPATAAAAAAWQTGVGGSEIAAALAAFRPVRGRSMLTRPGGQVTLVGDYYNSSPLAVEAALELLAVLRSPRHVAILGDMFELGADAPDWHARCGACAARSGVDLLVCVGQISQHTWRAALEAGMSPAQARWFSTKGEVLDALDELVRSGDAILVKASRGMGFEDIAERINQLFNSCTCAQTVGKIP